MSNKFHIFSCIVKGALHAMIETATIVLEEVVVKKNVAQYINLLKLFLQL